MSDANSSDRPPLPSKPAHTALLPLCVAILITLVVSVYPPILTDKEGHTDYWAALMIFWAMTAGYVRGVGFIPRVGWCRWLLSSWALAVAVLFVIGRQFV